MRVDRLTNQGCNRGILGERVDIQLARVYMLLTRGVTEEAWGEGGRGAVEYM